MGSLEGHSRGRGLGRGGGRKGEKWCKYIWIKMLFTSLKIETNKILSNNNCLFVLLQDYSFKIFRIYRLGEKTIQKNTQYLFSTQLYGLALYITTDLNRIPSDSDNCSLVWLIFPLTQQTKYTTDVRSSFPWPWVVGCYLCSEFKWAIFFAGLLISWQRTV